MKLQKPRICKKCSKQFKSSMQKRICFPCLLAEKKARREERAKRKLERKLNSKKWLNEENKRVKKECDKLWKESVALHCGKGCVVGFDCKGGLNCHHIISRKNKSTRWYIPNGIYLCAGHHTFFNNSAHRNPLWFRKFIVDTRGEAWERDLIEKGNQAWDKDIYKIKDYLLNELK